MNNRVSHFISHHGCPHRVQIPHKPSPDQRKKNNDHATFSQNFIGGLNSPIKFHRYASHHPTSNYSSAISHVVTLVALTSLIGTTISASPSVFFNSRQNAGRRSNSFSASPSTNPQTPVPQPTSPPLPIVGSTPRSTRRPPRVTKEHNGAVFREQTTIAYGRTGRKNIALHQPQQQSPPILDRPGQHPDSHHPTLSLASPSKVRSIRAIEWNQMKTRAGFLIELWFVVVK
ncbi:hypothetical protein ACVBEF_06115 [Glaciimonas sp. GG7]